MNERKKELVVKNMNENLREFVDEVRTSNFFITCCHLSKEQKDSHDDKICLIQSMMLLDVNNDIDFNVEDFSDEAILEYSVKIKDDYGDRQRNTLKSALQYLDDAFEERNEYIAEFEIPILVYLADVAEYKEIHPGHFYEWWICFTEDELFKTYREFCEKAFENWETRKSRFLIMRKSFWQYFKLEM